MPENISWKDGLPSFDILIPRREIRPCLLEGRAVTQYLQRAGRRLRCLCAGPSGSAVEEGLRDFHGAGRRFEYKGEYHGAKVYDDYAHHPDELHALLTMARSLGCPSGWW